MSQVTIYLPDEVINEARRRAKQEKTSLSSFISSMLMRETSFDQWPPSFIELLESDGADLREPDDPPAEEPEVIDPAS